MRSLQLCAVAILIGLFSSLITTKASAENVPSECPVTLPMNGSFKPTSATLTGPIGEYARKKKTFLYGSDKLFVALPANGTWKTLTDWRQPKFAYEGTLPWFRVDPSFSGKDGSLTVTLHQLDLRKYPHVQNSGLQDYSMELVPFDESETVLKAAIKIPTAGCWQITGHYKDQNLSFVVWVHVNHADSHDLKFQDPSGSSIR